MLSLSSDRPQVGPAGFAELVAREDSMKIARFDGGRIGVVVGDTIRDVTAAAGVDPAEWPPVGTVRLIANFAALRDKLAAAALPAIGRRH
jgi:hypothetical protein